MTFVYVCGECGKRFEEEHSIGKAPRTVPCPACGKVGKRVYDGMSIAVRVGGHTSRSTFGEQMKSRNQAAGRRMQGRKPPVRVVAYDHGGGDVRAVK
jgi:putative FmdB family regulatory protein